VDVSAEKATSAGMWIKWFIRWWLTAPVIPRWWPVPGRGFGLIVSGRPRPVRELSDRIGHATGIGWCIGCLNAFDHSVEVSQDLLVHPGDPGVTGGFGGLDHMRVRPDRRCQWPWPVEGWAR